MQPNAASTKAAVLKYIPIGTPIKEAANLMENHGFKCKPIANTKYHDDAAGAGEQESRGPANILWCDSGERASGLALVSKRWQVGFRDVDGKVADVGVGVGLTGP